MHRTYRVIYTLIFFLISQVLIAQMAVPHKQVQKKTEDLTEDGKRIYYTQRIVSSSPKIDGNLNDDCWKEGKWSGNYIQHMPNEGAEPSQETHIKILYDDKNIYVAIRAFDDEPDKIDKQLGRRDRFIGDIVGVNFDSYHDQRTGFEFNLTAGGGKLDVVVFNYGFDTNWNAVWEGKVGYEDSAWTAEMRIPLSQLRYSNKKEQIWGLHSWRWINRHQEESNWDLIPRDNPGIMRSIGEIHGIKNLPKSRRIEFSPYTVGKAKYYAKEEGNPYATGKDYDLALGLDSKIGISSDFTLDLTINPDFGQVEADPGQLNLSAYETFFDEKRPFFLEGSNITNFKYGGNRLFYSRRVGSAPSYSPELNDGEFSEKITNTSILGAVKLTGKTKNGLSIGIIEGLTAKEKAEISTDLGKDKITVEPLTNYFVARVQKDANEGNTLLGGMLTSTNRVIDENHLEYLNNNAITGGIDLLHHWKNKEYYIDFKGIFSHVEGSNQSITDLQYSSARYYQRPDAEHVEIDSSLTQLSGYGGELEIGKRSGGKLRFNGRVRWNSPGLELNDIGFMRRADLISPNFNIRYVVNEPKGKLLEYSYSAWQGFNLNFAGEYLNAWVGTSASFKFNNKWGTYMSYSRSFNEFNTTILRGGPAIYTKGLHRISGGGYTDGSKKLSFGFNYNVSFFDSKISSGYYLSPRLSYKITPSTMLSANLNYSPSVSGFQYIYTDYENEYFMASLDRKNLGLTLRLDYAITPELTLQYYGNPYISVGQYSKFKQIIDPKSKDYNKLYHEFSNNEISYNQTNNEYNFSYNGNNYTIGNPDFNYQQFRSNFVVRWEYKTGSTFYFVWSHNRSQYENVTNLSLNENISELSGIQPENLFLVKFNYWFTI